MEDHYFNVTDMIFVQLMRAAQGVGVLDGHRAAFSERLAGEFAPAGHVQLVVDGRY